MDCLGHPGPNMSSNFQGEHPSDLLFLRSSHSDEELARRPDDAWNDCEERAQAP